MKTSALILADYAAPRIYGPDEIASIREITNLKDGVFSREKIAEDPSALADVEIMFSGWGAPVLDKAFLAAAPKLEAVFYGAGSIRYMVTPEFWAREIPITSAWYPNGIPVAEMTEALIIMSLKKFWKSVRNFTCPAGHRHEEETVRGAWKSTVGLVSLGMIGKLVAERMKSHDVKVVAYDPFVSQERADSLELGVRMVSLEELFATSDAVSLHTPNLPETRGMITGELFASMKQGAAFINTARGAVVDEPAMIEALKARPDIYACLDVTSPDEPPAEGSALYTLPNVVLSPHIAGAVGDECRRLGEFTVAECARFLRGEPLQWRVSEKMAETMA